MGGIETALGAPLGISGWVFPKASCVSLALQEHES